MGKVYKGGFVQVTTTNKLLSDAKLAPVIVKAAVEIDMSGAPLSMGEWSGNETVQERGRAIIGDILSTWVEETQTHFSGPVKTMLFASSIAHGSRAMRSVSGCWI